MQEWLRNLHLRSFTLSSDRQGPYRPDALAAVAAFMLICLHPDNLLLPCFLVIIGLAIIDS